MAASTSSSLFHLPTGSLVPIDQLERVQGIVLKASPDNLTIIATCVNDAFQDMSLNHYRTLERLKLTSSTPEVNRHIQNILTAMVRFNADGHAHARCIYIARRIESKDNVKIVPGGVPWRK